MALIDALRMIAEPLRYLIDRVDTKADKAGKRAEEAISKVDNIEFPAPVQSDMAQGDADAPDYIKNRIAYDITNRKKIFEGILGGFRYGGEFFYSAEYDFVLKPNALYRIEVAHGGVIDSTVQRSAEIDGGYGINVVIVLDIAQVYNVSTDQDDGKSTFACYYFDEIPRKVTIFEVEEAEDVKTVPRHLMYNLPHAAADTLGAVMVFDNLENQTDPGVIWDSADITTDKYGKLHVRREVQTPWSVPDGHILAATNKAWKSADIKDILPTTVPQVQTASVGQTVVVKAVDASGKPTEWEAKDVSGGACGGSELAVQFSINPDGTQSLVSDVNIEDVYNALTNEGKRVTLYVPPTGNAAPKGAPVTKWNKNTVGDQLQKLQIISESSVYVLTSGEGGTLATDRVTWEKEVGIGEKFIADGCTIALATGTISYETMMTFPVNPTA